MAKTLNSLFSFRRTYAAAAQKVTDRPSPVKMIKEVTDAAKETTEETKGREAIFWMRDPKTGNWIPENHFGDVDVAELREKLLPKNP